MTWIEDLEAKARAAHDNDGWFDSEGVEDFLCATDDPKKAETGAFIAAADPATVLRLCELLAATRETLKFCIENIQGCMDGTDIPSMVIRDNACRLLVRLEGAADD